MLEHESWLDLARKLDWNYSYVSEEQLFPAAVSGRPWLPRSAWQGWDEPYRTSYAGYVTGQADKERAVAAVCATLGRRADLEALSRDWRNGLKLHAAVLPLAEFAATVGNLRAARFARDAAWRSTALLGALDECRHTQIPLRLMHELLPWDGQFDWTHRLYHSNNWVAIAARHLFDELILFADPIELAVATNFVFETGFTNLQFIGLAALADAVRDRLFETMVTSIQTDEARHAQIGPAVLEVLVDADPARVQYLVDKWFWRSWQLVAILTGFSMDYLSPVARRRWSFREFLQEWVVEQFARTLERHGLHLPWYWDQFLEATGHYHHMVYATAYTYRATVWFNMVLPGPEARRWLRAKYPGTWAQYEPIWERIAERWRHADPGVDLAVHGTAIVGFCNLCQVVLSGGSPAHNTACTLRRGDQSYVFCSAPCRWIFESEPERYQGHPDLVKRVLAGEAPGNLIALLTRYCDLSYEQWGKDEYAGDYPWLERVAPERR
jgi:toluene monooxygenase system protein A